MLDNVGRWIEETADGEEILGVVVGERPWGNNDDWPTPNVLHRWDDVKRTLYANQFFSGYGSIGCPEVCAWTASKVIAVSQYDGSTSVFALPRHPIPHNPIMPGGGG